MLSGDASNASAEEHTQQCQQILADANLSVQEHNKFLCTHSEDLLFSLRDILFITQQRDEFIEQLKISVIEIVSLIAHQQALFEICHGFPIDPTPGCQFSTPTCSPRLITLPRKPLVATH
jgi:hypothetical protein